MNKTLLTTTFAALSVAGAGTAPAGLVAHYSFDSDYTDSAAAIGGGTLTASGGTPNITATAVDVKFGAGALNLDQSGTDFEHLSFASAFSFDGTSAYSVSWWGKRDSASGNGAGGIVGTLANSNDFIWTPDNSGVVQGLRVRDSSGTSTDFGGIPDDNAYHHWAVVYDGASSVTVYRDNASLGSKTFSGDLDLTHVGVATANKGNGFFGQIDELYIFDEAIDAATVNSLFTSNVVPEPGSLALLGLGGLCVLRRRR